MESLKNLIVIPARGGSKRLKGKNTKSFCGKPLICYTIAFAKISDNYSKIVVSTDNEEIAKISTKMNIEVIFRPKHLASDTAKTSSAVKHALEQLEKGGKETYDLVTTLQVTNPLRPKNLLSKALHKFNVNTEITSLLSVSASKIKFGNIKNGHYDPLNYSFGDRSQDLNPTYYENGNLYVSRAELIRKGDLFGENVFALVQDGDPTIDIDDKMDFKMGELLFNYNLSKFGYLDGRTRD